MLPVLQVGPVAMPVAPLLILLGLWIGLEAAEQHAPRYGISTEHFYRMALVGIAAGLICARAGYLAQHPIALPQSPWLWLSPRPEMLLAWAGWIGALLAMCGYALWKRLQIWRAADAAVSALALLAVAIGASHLASGRAFGSESTVPWAITLWGAARHPTQIYEILAALFALALIWPRRWNQTMFASQPGLRWWVFCAVSALARILIEGFRGDSTLIGATLRQAQVIAWFILAVSLWQIGLRLPAHSRSSPPADTEHQTMQEGA